MNAAMDTPTDDEKEALACVILDVQRTPLDRSFPRQAEALDLAGIILTAGFRRTEVPDPKLDPKPWIVRGYFGDYVGRTTSVDPLTKGDHLFKPRPGYEQERAAYDAADIELPETHSDPTGSLYPRAFDDFRDSNPEWMEGSPFDIGSRFWRAALRAVGGTR